MTRISVGLNESAIVEVLKDLRDQFEQVCGADYCTWTVMAKNTPVGREAAKRFVEESQQPHSYGPPLAPLPYGTRLTPLHYASYGRLQICGDYVQVVFDNPSAGR